MKGVAITDIGKIRDVNEDSYCIYEDEIDLYIVADGMGGHKGCEVASLIATDSIKEHIIKYLPEEYQEPAIKGVIFEAFNRANQNVYKHASENTEYDGMGTTVTMALIIGNKLYIGHVGDSRAYLLRSKSLKQITEDHSLVAELVKNGSITEREAMRHPQKNIITRSLGTDVSIKVDIFAIDLEKEDTIILCSDGLTNFVDDREIKEILLPARDPLESCQALVSLANKRGGYDNITVIIVKTQLGSGQEVGEINDW